MDLFNAYAAGGATMEALSHAKNGEGRRAAFWLGVALLNVVVVIP